MSEPISEISEVGLHFKALANLFYHASLCNPAVGLIIGSIDIENTIQSNFPVEYNTLGQFIKLKGLGVLGWYGYKVPDEHKFKIHKQLESITKKSLYFIDVEPLQLYKMTGTTSLELQAVEYRVIMDPSECENLIKLAAQDKGLCSNKKDIGERQTTEMINNLSILEKVLDKVDMKTYHAIYKVICEMINA